MHRFVADVYTAKFPELESLVPAKRDYVQVVQRIGNEMVRKKGCFFSICISLICLFVHCGLCVCVCLSLWVGVFCVVGSRSCVPAKRDYVQVVQRIGNEMVRRYVCVFVCHAFLFYSFMCLIVCFVLCAMFFFWGVHTHPPTHPHTRPRTSPSST